VKRPARPNYRDIPTTPVVWIKADGARMPPASLRQRVTEFYWRNPDGVVDLRSDPIDVSDLTEVNEDGTPVEPSAEATP
jgi:hypothetical protein